MYFYKIISSKNIIFEKMGNCASANEKPKDKKKKKDFDNDDNAGGND